MALSKFLNIKLELTYYWITLFSRSSLTLLVLVYFTLPLSAQTNKIVLRPKIDNLVSKLRQEDEVHFGYPVGYAGRPETNNKHYKQYLKLKDQAKDEELVLLTQDTSKCIVVYSYDILWRRQYPNLKSIFLQHQNDTTFFWTASGCTGSLCRVNWFMLWKLRPSEKEGVNSNLTKEEYEIYCDKFKKTDSLFTCN